MNKLLILVLSVILLSSSCVSVAQTERIENKYMDYNVVVVAFDALQSKHLNEFGYDVVGDITPNLSQFLKDSTVFVNTVSASSWTVPSFMSIFTSMYPSEHKIVNKYTAYDYKKQVAIGADLRKDSPFAVTLAQTMKNNGYNTAAFTADAGMSSSFGFDMGFDTWFQTKQPFGSFDETMPLAEQWMKDNKDKGKFFLFVHGYDIHGQSQPKEGFDYRYVDERSANVGYVGSSAEQAKIREAGLGGALSLTDEQVKFWRAIYDEKINRSDAKFGAFLDGVNEMGLMDKTIFVILSDHGTEFYEHKTFDHGHTLYGELIDTVFAVRVPKGRGVRVIENVSTLDVFPTVLGLTGRYSVLEQFRGVDLSKVILMGAPCPVRDLYSETDYRLYTHKRCVQTSDGWKMIMTMHNDHVDRELYNVEEDPGEVNNVASIYTKEAYILEQKIYSWLNEMNSNGPWTYGCLPVYGDQCRDIQ